jgi:hypothetical protein
MIGPVPVAIAVMRAGFVRRAPPQRKGYTAGVMSRSLFKEV